MRKPYLVVVVLLELSAVLGEYVEPSSSDTSQTTWNFNIANVTGEKSVANAEQQRLETAFLYGAIYSYAYYFLDVLIGHPSQRESVILDTGSSLLGFPCKGCPRCGNHIDAPFDFSVSTTAKWLSCESPACPGKCSAERHCSYYQKYSEGSAISGLFFEDLVALGDFERHNPFVWFNSIGCHDQETKLFSTQKASGIMGVSFPKFGRTNTIIDALFGSPDVNTRVFAICIGDEGGVLTVGGYNASLHVRSDLTFSSPNLSTLVAQARKLYSVAGSEKRSLSFEGSSIVEVPIAWTKVTSTSSYRVRLTNLSFDGEDLSNSFGSTIVDSGTTFTYFPPALQRRILRRLEAKCKELNNCVAKKCFRTHSPQTLNLPSFILQFYDQASVEWKPNSYLYETVKNVWCPAIEGNHEDSTVLGASFMKNKNIIFDRAHDLIGFACAVCPTHRVDDRPAPRKIIYSTGQTKVAVTGNDIPARPVTASISSGGVLPNISTSTHFLSSTDSKWKVAGIALSLVVFGMIGISCQTFKRRTTHDDSYAPVETADTELELQDECDLSSDLSDESSLEEDINKIEQNSVIV